MRWAIATAVAWAAGAWVLAQESRPDRDPAESAAGSGMSDGGIERAGEMGIEATGEEYDPDRDVIEMWQRLAQGEEDDFGPADSDGPYVYYVGGDHQAYDIYDDGYYVGPGYSVSYGYPYYYWPSYAPLCVSSLMWGPAYGSGWYGCARSYGVYGGTFGSCGVPCEPYGGSSLSLRFGGSNYWGRVYYGTAYSVPPCGPRPTLYEIPRREYSPVARSGVCGPTASERRAAVVREVTVGPARTRDGWVATPAVRQRRGNEVLQPTRLIRERERAVQAGRPATGDRRGSERAVAGGRGAAPQPPVSSRSWQSRSAPRVESRSAGGRAALSPRSVQRLGGITNRNLSTAGRGSMGTQRNSQLGSRPGMGNVRRP